MIQTKGRFLEVALEMGEPRVIPGTGKGSLRALFELRDGTVPSLGYEIPRSLFNGLRSEGILYEDPENPVKVGSGRTFHVKLESQDG